MGVLHDLLAKINLVHDNQLALADPVQATTQAQQGFFGATADLVHNLEARIKTLESALFGEKQSTATAASTAPADTGAPAIDLLAGTSPAPAPVEPAADAPAGATAEPAAPAA